MSFTPERPTASLSMHKRQNESPLSNRRWTVDNTEGRFFSLTVNIIDRI